MLELMGVNAKGFRHSTGLGGTLLLQLDNGVLIGVCRPPKMPSTGVIGAILEQGLSLVKLCTHGNISEVGVGVGVDVGGGVGVGVWTGVVLLCAAW